MILIDAAQLAPHRKIQMLDLDDPAHLDFVTRSRRINCTRLLVRVRWLGVRISSARVILISRVEARLKLSPWIT